MSPRLAGTESSASATTTSGARIHAARRGVSALQLDAGRLFCFLFTDITNPTSNHIYQEIGYEPIRDVEEFRFDRA